MAWAHRVRGNVVNEAKDRALDELAQGLRKAHCARTGEHECVGTCTITRAGVQLECKLCGNESKLIAPLDTLPIVRKAKLVLAAAGLEWDALSDARKRAVVEALEGKAAPAW